MKILFVGLILLSIYSCIHSFAAHYPAGKNRPCCVSVFKKNISTLVTGNEYREQPAKYPCVNAVIFTTTEGQVCADPGASWVKKQIVNMKKVR
ncbi:unnamed protein product [Menidia menidia]|uniref:(Atlantic silverside) hypothetical protein n=1 Tax=Menidia menidia TaxID=238744 RepID=A0A8S4ANR8_9TELE|nr:unnamed protein product [Menidia menidia]